MVKNSESENMRDDYERVKDKSWFFPERISVSHSRLNVYTVFFRLYSFKGEINTGRSIRKISQFRREKVFERSWLWKIHENDFLVSEIEFLVWFNNIQSIFLASAEKSSFKKF